ncbi:MAG TPA: DUF3341 domain-containing protein [Pirellulaceae bacterium]|nr:DUF3341 domain-containing protein [Pirellulaceae bacterium]
MNEPLDLYGLLAEFEHPEELLAAAAAAHDAGYRRVEAYTPIPLPGLTEALGTVPTQLPRLTLLGGLAGAAAGYALQYWVSVIEYPLNVGGRPLHSWPAFLPIVFELAILGASLTAVLGMLALNGLPRPHHPLFAVPEFRLASRDRFFLCIESRDAKFDLAQTREFLSALHPKTVIEVPR